VGFIVFLAAELFVKSYVSRIQCHIRVVMSAVIYDYCVAHNDPRSL